MMRRMATRPRAALLACCLLAAACGGGSSDPDRPLDDWEPTFDRAVGLSRDGRHAEAIAVGEEYLKKYPDNVAGHLILADAARFAAEAASDASRQRNFELALTHYTRVGEISKNSMSRAMAAVGSIQVTGAKALNRPAEAERLARLFVADEPTSLYRHEHLVKVLAEARRYPELVKAFDEARANGVVDAKTTAKYGGLVHDVAVFTEGFPADTARPLLAGALALNEQELGRDATNMALLNNKGMLLRAQANIESDPARQRALLEQSKAAFDEHDRLDKR
jgi:tetratricopeptide (TPR) repeat protein